MNLGAINCHITREDEQDLRDIFYPVHPVAPTLIIIAIWLVVEADRE